MVSSIWKHETQNCSKEAENALLVIGMPAVFNLPIEVFPDVQDTQVVAIPGNPAKRPRR